MPGPSIRRARPDQAALLTGIAHAAKRHWGYPETWMTAWRDALTITPELIAAGEVYVAAPGDGEPGDGAPGDGAPRDAALGFHALTLGGRTAVLEHLWIRPASIGRGVGRALLAHAVERARAAGAWELRIDADPHAEGFYLRMGARRVGEVPADVGGTARVLPRLVLPLRPPSRPAADRPDPGHPSRPRPPDPG